MGLPRFKMSRFAIATYTTICFFIVHYLYLAGSGSLPYNLSHLRSAIPRPWPKNTNVPIVAPLRDFPRKIWQTSKTSPGGMDEADLSSLSSWTKMNQKYRYESMTQFSAESYVRDRFAAYPDLVEVFVDLQDPILRADLIRYLVLWGDGGIYSDVDTKVLKPIEEWIPDGLARNVSVVVGVEYDVLDGGRWADWTLDLQFCTWTIMARPGHILMERTADRVVTGLKHLAQKQGVTISGLKASFRDVLDTTGPALFTEAVLEYLEERTRSDFTWQNLTGLTRQRLVADVLILPITAFGSGQRHSGSGSPDDEGALVQHLFKGSWKGDHPDRPENEEEDQHEEKEDKEEEKEEEAENQSQQPNLESDQESSKKTNAKEKEEEQHEEEDARKKEEKKEEEKQKERQEEEEIEEKQRAELKKQEKVINNQLAKQTLGASKKEKPKLERRTGIRIA